MLPPRTYRCSMCPAKQRQAPDAPREYPRLPDGWAYIIAIARPSERGSHHYACPECRAKLTALLPGFAP